MKLPAPVSYAAHWPTTPVLDLIGEGIGAKLLQWHNMLFLLQVITVVVGFRFTQPKLQYLAIKNLVPYRELIHLQSVLTSSLLRIVASSPN